MLAPGRLEMLRWLMRELSTDNEDMIALIANLPDGDDDDSQALLQELVAPNPEPAIHPLRTDYQDGKQLLGPKEALRIIEISRASLYSLLKRGTFPGPVLIGDSWKGWPREILLEWADASERKKLAELPHSGYAPFERYISRKAP